jgi:uncharacterized protein YkwD
VRLRTSALAAGLLACAGGVRGPARPPEATPSAPAALEVARGRYGEEPPVALSALEAEALAAVRSRQGGAARLSGALVVAARDLARRAAAGDADPLARAHLRAALARGLAADPAPLASLVVARATSAPAALGASLQGPSDATHLGIGAAARGGQAAIVLLRARRTASLRPFPREVPVGAREVLAGEVVGLDAPAVHLTAPSGASRAARDEGGGARAFRAALAFDAPGRWVVEVVGRGPRGPEVAALLTVSCGGVPLEEAAGAEEPDPPERGAAEEAVLHAVDALRARQGLPPLERSAALSEVARRHSEAMLAAGQVAHVLPGTGDVRARLARAGIGYAVALENVARGPSALAAQRGLEESPAHRENMLSREATRAGAGVARGALPSGDPIVYLTQILVAPVEDGSDDRLSPEARVREALWRARARAGATPLAADAALDAIARDAARDMQRRGEPSAADAPARALALRRTRAAADAFVAARAADATRSSNIADARWRRAGVGVVVGDSPRYGAGMLWIVVLYSD